MESLDDAIAVILLFGGIPAIIVWITHTKHKTKHKEKMAMIEKGVDISAFVRENNPLYQVLMWGFLLVGVGIGLLIGYLLAVYASFEKDSIMPIMAVLFGGISLIIYYIFRKRSEKKDPI